MPPDAIPEALPPELQRTVTESLLEVPPERAMSEEEAAVCVAMLKAMTGLERDVAAYFAPKKKEKHAAWKAVCDTENTYLTPIKRRKDQMAFVLGQWENEKRRRLRENEEKAAAILRRQAEDDILARAAMAETPAEAERILNETPQVPMLKAPVEKTPGVSVRATYDWNVVDAALIPREYLQPDNMAIGQKVRQLGLEAMKAIPGIEVRELHRAVAR